MYDKGRIYTVYSPSEDRTHIFLEETEYANNGDYTVNVTFINWYQGEPNDNDTECYKKHFEYTIL